MDCDSSKPEADDTDVGVGWPQDEGGGHKEEDGGGGE